MQKILFAALLSAAAVSAGAQQKEFYLRAGLGYALPGAGQTIAGYSWPYSGSLRQGIQYNIEGASFSAGVNGSLALGYMLTNNVGIQLDATIGLANKTYEYTDYGVTVNYSNGTSILSDMTITHKASRPVNFIPSLVLQTAGEQWNIYSRTGVVVPANSTIIRERSTVNAPGTGATTVRRETWELKSNFSLGFAAAAGVQYKFSNSLSLWAEVSFVSMSLYINEANLTDYSYNGQSINIAQLGGTKRIQYANNVTLDTANYSVQPTYSQPFSNVAFNAGIRLSLSNGKWRVKNNGEAEKRKF